jgi:DNA repair protein RecO
MVAGHGAPVREPAIVLRVHKLGDSSKIVTVLTPEYGRVKVVAKGARQLRNRMANLLEPGNQLELMVYVRPGRDLWTLGDAALVRGVLTGANGLDKLSYLLAALELADRLVAEQQPVPEIEAIYRLYLERWHEASDETMAGLFFALELAMLDALGAMLDVEFCGECGRRFAETALVARTRVMHRASDGFLRCTACSAGGGRWVEAECLAPLLALAEEPLERAAEALEPKERAAIGRLLHDHMGYHLPNYRVPRALYWLSGEDASAKRNTT